MNLLGPGGFCKVAAAALSLGAVLHTGALQAQVPVRGYVAVEFARLDNPGATTVIRAINSASEVAGAFRTNPRKASSAQVFLATGAEDLLGESAGTGHSVAYGINDQGEIAGAFNSAVALRPFRAVRKIGVQELSLPVGANGGAAFAINELGEAAGYASGSAGIRPVWWSRAGAAQLLQSAGALPARALDLNDKGDVVGVSGDKAKSAVLWLKKGGLVSLTSLPGFEHSEAVSIAENGAIAGVASGSGGSTTGATRFRAVLWQPSSLAIEDLGTLPGGSDSRARRVNARGEVVGSSSSANGERAFIWTAASGMRDLNTLVNVPGLVLTDALSINKKGDIVAVGHDALPVVAGHENHEHQEDHDMARRLVVLHPLP
jgi:probable HAF family extracellular repeat protein